jgi:hypothetical protein
MVQVVECLLQKQEVLSSNPCSEEKKYQAFCLPINFFRTHSTTIFSEITKNISTTLHNIVFYVFFKARSSVK